MFLFCCFVLFCLFFFFDYPFIELEPFCRVEACGREVKTANLAVPDPDCEIRGWGRGGWSSTPLDKCGRGCWSPKKNFFPPFGPQFGPKIRVAPRLEPPLLGICKSRLRCFLRRETLFHQLSLFTQAYEWVSCDILSGDGLVFRLGLGDQFPCVLHATLRKTERRFVRTGLAIFVRL